MNLYFYLIIPIYARSDSFIFVWLEDGLGW